MIELTNVTKSYPTNLGRKYIFRNLSFKIPDGANVGLIGKNGSGKSTLMRLLGGLDMPDSGKVAISGSVSWPVGLSGGFQGSLTGRQNVKFVCRLYGARGDDMRRIISAVEDFAEIGSYFDLPVRMYSSGMRARLAFGLSLSFDFDYYLVDEAMSVGDSQFRKKASAAFKKKMGQANMILVTHGMSQVREFCDVVLYIKNGEAKLFDNVEDGIKAYQKP